VNYLDPAISTGLAVKL